MSSARAPATQPMDIRWLRWSLAAIAVLLTLIAVELSVLVGPVQPRAQAQVPDSGAQLYQLIEGQKQLNRTLQQILDQLRSGEIKVTLSSTDKDPRGTLTPAPRTGKATAKPQPVAGRAK